ncbi:MAG: diacylglycerol/lipid kinase family protein [Acidimicrobiia bacterium]
MTRPLRHGEPWGRAASGPPDVEVAGGDGDLVAAVASHPGALVRYRPSPGSDLARALGLGPDGAGTTEVAIDALAIDRDDGAVDAVNVVVLGPPPDRLRWTVRASHITVRVDGRAWFNGRATTVVVANGQFLRGADLVPRGHPGDGWAEVQVYALARRARRAMRRRLPTGTHVPHPGVRSGRAHRVEVEVARPLPVEVDGRPRGRTARLVITLVPAAIRLLV